MIKAPNDARLRHWLVVGAVAAAAALGAAPAAGGAPDLEPPPADEVQLEPGGADAEVATAAATPEPSSEVQTGPLADPGDGALEEYDPWEPFNARTFAFNRQLDRVVLKPAATAWDKVVPDEGQRMLKNVLKNVGMPRRLVNNLLQGKFDGAARELGRFILNSSLGIGGLFDVAAHAGVEESDEDTGQTLATWGVGTGPYLVLPFLPPLTVRDGVGFVVDSLLDPTNYVAPFAADFGRSAGDRLNERSLNLEVVDDFEAATLDMYSATRNAYLQRRQKAIRE